MPHLVILYTGTLERHGAAAEVDLGALCRALADCLIAQRDPDAGGPVFPVGGVRVMAYPAAHHAVADGGAAGRAAGGDGVYDFVYLNLRMGRGRSAAVHQEVGRALHACAQAHFAPLLATRHIGITVQVDEGLEVFDAKSSSLHPLFQPAPTSKA